MTTLRLGRATIPVAPDEEAPALQSGLRLAARVHRPLFDDVLLVIEGPFLPSWSRGMIPYQFDSLESLYEFREQARSRIEGTAPDWRPLASQ